MSHVWLSKDGGVFRRWTDVPDDHLINIAWWLAKQGRTLESFSESLLVPLSPLDNNYFKRLAEVDAEVVRRGLDIHTKT